MKTKSKLTTLEEYLQLNYSITFYPEDEADFSRYLFGLLRSQILDQPQV
jgi:hypothetical protein